MRQLRLTIRGMWDLSIEFVDYKSQYNYFLSNFMPGIFVL